MKSGNELDEVLTLLRRAFPSMHRHDTLNRSHTDWVKLRDELHSLAPDEVVEVFPFVLADLAVTAAGSRFEDGAMVIYFLDVWAESIDFCDSSQRTLIEKFADEEIGGEAGEEFKIMMLSELPRPKGISREEQHAQDRRDREASFAKLTHLQCEAMFRWLMYIRNFEAFEHCRVALLSAILYWRLRSSSTGGAN